MTLFLKVHCAEHNRPSTARETERLLRRHFLPRLGDAHAQRYFHTRHFADHGRDARDAYGGQQRTRRARTLFRWATRRRYLPHSPMEGLQMPAKKLPRSRVLTPLELRPAFAYGRQTGVYGQIIRLLILTGQRVGPVPAPYVREFIGGRHDHLACRAMKGNREHTIPIGPLTQAELAKLPDALSFNNWSTRSQSFLQSYRPRSPHAPRPPRKLSTVMAEWTPPHLLSRLLAHAQPRRACRSTIAISTLRKCATLSWHSSAGSADPSF